MSDISTRLPYRVVDASNQGWHSGPDTELGVLYTADYGFNRDLEPCSYPHLVATRGPLRPVEPITDEDQAELRALFGAAGRKTITTLAAALDTVFEEIREAQGGLQAPGSYEHARRTLMSGREGSWESELLIEIVMIGNELNLAKPTGSLHAHDVAARRAAGPSKRVDAAVRTALARVLLRWVSDPGRYTEVAETLAFVVSRYCDDQAGPQGGWRAVADQWLQPGGLAQDTFSACYRLFYSLSDHFDTSLI